MKVKTAYVILTKSINETTRNIEIKISQEAYDSLEKAQAFLERRVDSYKIDEFNYESYDQYDFGFSYQYTIVPINII